MYKLTATIDGKSRVYFADFEPTRFNLSLSKYDNEYLDYDHLFIEEVKTAPKRSRDLNGGERYLRKDGKYAPFRLLTLETEYA